MLPFYKKQLRRDFSAIYDTFRDCVYMVGGHILDKAYKQHQDADGGGPVTLPKSNLKFCEKLSVEKKEWTEMPDLNEARCQTAMFLVSNYLYAF